MNTLSSQADELRLTADNISERGVSSSDLAIIEIRLREAADTIENMRDKLQESERHNLINLEVMGEMYHPEIVELIQECHATQANYEHCKYSTDRGWCDTSRYANLFGTPERAARTLEKQCDPFHCVVCPAYHRAQCDEGDYDKLLEWLRGER